MTKPDKEQFLLNLYHYTRYEAVVLKDYMEAHPKVREQIEKALKKAKERAKEKHNLSNN